MNIVLDTNVLVSGLLSPFKAPGEIVRMTADRQGVRIFTPADFLIFYRTQSK